MHIIRGVGAAFGEARAVLTAKSPDEDDEVEILMLRISEGMMPAFRREAMGQLKELVMDNPKAQLAIGNLGLPVLASVLSDDREDVDLLRGALEVLVLAMASDNVPHRQQNAQPQDQESLAGLVNADLFSRTPAHVPLLLSLLEEEPVGSGDFYVRLHVLQLLTALLQGCPQRLGPSILGSPMGVVRLMDMLGEREVIRNEALLLLVELSATSAEVQKIAAFEGAFDRAFNIVRDEGYSDGGLVVQDSIQFINNLLRGNVANQRLFREMGYIAHIPKLLSLTSSEKKGQDDAAKSFAGDEDGARGAASEVQSFAEGLVSHLSTTTAAAMSSLSVSRQKAINLLSALETVTILAQLPSPNKSNNSDEAQHRAAQESVANRSTNIAKLIAEPSPNSGSSSVLKALLKLCLEERVESTAVQCQALKCLGHLALSYGPGQEALAAASVSLHLPFPPLNFNYSSGSNLSALGGPRLNQGIRPLPVLHAAVRLALYARDSRERAAALDLLAGFCCNNPEGQTVLASTIAPLGDFSIKDSTDDLIVPCCETFGEEIVAAFTLSMSSGSASSSGASNHLQVWCHAALATELLLNGCPAAKRRLLTTPLKVPRNTLSPVELLMPQALRHVSDALKQQTSSSMTKQGKRAALLLLRLVIVWAHECQEAADAVVLSPGAPKSGASAHLPMLVDAITGLACGPLLSRSSGGVDPLVAGLAASLLATCLVYGSPLCYQTVIDAVISRAGLATFIHRLEDLQGHPSVVVACSPQRGHKAVNRAGAALAFSDALEENDEESERGGRDLDKSLDGVFDPKFLAKLKADHSAATLRATEGYCRPPDRSDLSLETPPSSLGEAIEALRRKDEELLSLRSRNMSMARELVMKQANERSADKQASEQGSTDPSPLSKQGSPSSSMMDIEARVAAEVKATKAEAEAVSLKRQIHMLESRLGAAEAEAKIQQSELSESLQGSMRLEGELRDLSQAYNSLEAHAFTIEGKLKEAERLLATKLDPKSDGSTPSLHPSTRWISESDAENRVKEVKDEADEQLNDLFVCLGQEEAKVSLLSAKLLELGIDTVKLLEL